MKTTKKVLSAMLAIALVCCMALTAFAAQAIGITEDANPGIAAQKVQKTWTAASLSQMNNTEAFNFQLAYVGATAVGTNQTAVPQYNSADFATKQVSITGNWLDQATQAQSTSATNEISYVDLFDGITFSAPGVYEFTLTEIAGTNPNIDYSEASYKLKVTVAWATDELTGQPKDELAILGVVETSLSTDPTGEKLDIDEVVFPNTAVDNASLKVTKAVEGNAANVNDYFKFTVALSGISGTYDIAYTGNTYQEGETNPTSITAVEGAATFDIYLKHGESFEVKNLPETATYTVTEEDTDYTESVNDQDTNTANGTIGKDGATLNYVNTKTTVTPTGVFMDVLPYVVMLAVVAIGAGAFVVIRRRREEEQF